MSIASFFFTNFPKQYGFFLGIKERLFLPFKRLFFLFGANIFFGSKDQDKWVVKDIFKFRKKGYFVDLAATDGFHQNNTFFLEKRLKWKGICIEPNKFFYNKLIKRRKAKCFCEIITNKKIKVDYLINGGVGGIIGDQFDNNIKKREKLIKKAKIKNRVERRNTKSLYNILKIAKAPKVIDYLSLDVEGAEFEVLRNFPFNKYTFLSMTIERPPKELNKILFKNGYIFVKNYKVDTFYIHKSLKKSVNIKYEKFHQIGKKKW